MTSKSNCPWLNSSRVCVNLTQNFYLDYSANFVNKLFVFHTMTYKKVVPSIKREAMRHNILIMFFPY